MGYRKSKKIRVENTEEMRRIENLPNLKKIVDKIKIECDQLSGYGLTLDCSVLNKKNGSQMSHTPNDEQVLTALKYYLVIRYVSVIDNFFHVLVKHNFDLRDIPLDYLFKKTELPKTEFSRGTVISSQFKFQNWSTINRVMSDIIGEGLDFTETFKRFITNRDINLNFDRFVAKQQLENIWDAIESVFDYRHRMAHSIETIEIDARTVRALRIELETFFYVVIQMCICAEKLENENVTSTEYQEKFDNELEKLVVLQF